LAYRTDDPMQGFAPAFAKANAKAIVLIARNKSEVEAAAQEIRKINPKVNVLSEALDIRSKDSVQALFEKIKSEYGTADVLVNNAGSGKSALAIKDVDADDFWYDFVSSMKPLSSKSQCSQPLWHNCLERSFKYTANIHQEVNVKGTMLMTQSFLRLVGDTKPATIINVTSAGGIAIIPNTSSYSLSKLVQIQIQRFVAAENPNITAISLHPGTILTPVTKPVFVKFSKDTFALAGGVAVWLATEQAKFMNGRYMGANWSVDELTERRDEIVSKGLLLEELQGTFGPAQFQE
jgi:NAD(P)-dependent dehydrogenase (short-subunit alcohol dehydrogenase family)